MVAFREVGNKKDEQVWVGKTQIYFGTFFV